MLQQVYHIVIDPGIFLLKLSLSGNHIFLWEPGQTAVLFLKSDVFAQLINLAGFDIKLVSTYSPEQVLGAIGRIGVTCHVLLLSVLSVLLFVRFQG